MTRRLDQHTSDRPGTSDPLSTAAVSRRRLLVGGAVAAAVATIAAACSSEDSGTTGSTSTATASAGGVPDSDLKVAGLAAGLEVLAVNTYRGGLDAATAGKLGAVPPAVAEYAKTAMAQHEEHLAAWNNVLSGAGRSAVTAPNAVLKPTVDAEFAKVKDVGGLAALALMLEQIAAQTYLAAIPSLKSATAIRKAAEIQVVDQQHQAILLYTLGKYPVPEVFQSTSKAATG